MPALTLAHGAIWSIAALATLGIMVRPWAVPEAIWAVAGGLLLGLSTLLPWPLVGIAVARGANVYLFLVGMLLLAELGRQQGLFDWLAALAARRARGSPRRLFDLVYVVGILVTMLLSNDATAVVLTPAVYAVARTAKAPALPYLFICAFIANAASFLLPISNPANLVVFGDQLPPLATWLARFALPSVTAIGVTYLGLRLSHHHALEGEIAQEIPMPKLSAGARFAAAGIVLTALLLLGASAAKVALGAPSCLAGILTTAVVLMRNRASPWPLLRGISWGILPLVAGLFVLVQGIELTGILTSLDRLLQVASAPVAASGIGTAKLAWSVGIGTALACNVTNNLPIALVAGTALRSAALAPVLGNVMMIGVDLGPNLSITGSLASILWIVALRREGEPITAMQFLRQGMVVVLPALLASLAVSIWLGSPR